jgi:uncharacterized protein YodC (DUF2158 family)
MRVGKLGEIKMDKIVEGDTVYLKSGSPKMTVVKVDELTATVIYCAYGTNNIVWDDFVPLIALRKAFDK